jgi:hypothetical protein
MGDLFHCLHVTGYFFDQLMLIRLLGLLIKVHPLTYFVLSFCSRVYNSSIYLCQQIVVATCSKAVFLNRRAAAQFGTAASIIPGREGFSWKLSF